MTTQHKDQFRNYIDSARQEIVSDTYRKNHSLQTYSHVQEMKKAHLKFDKAKMSVWEAIEKLNRVIDDTDPDADFPQIFHALQTAETLRKQWPDHDWLHLCGVLHDLGKVLALPEFGGLPQWNVVGDTFPVGCKHSSEIVMNQFFVENPDCKDSLYNTDFGVYSPKCGLDNVNMSWGHDEYMYQVCVHNGCTLPPAALKVIRFHSFYAWHNKGEYQNLMDDSDREALPWVQRFQRADLYSKADAMPNPPELMPYYKGLVDKYFPKEVLDW